MTQPVLFKDVNSAEIAPFKTQLLKWVGNKQRFAFDIVHTFPRNFNRYFEPFLGSGAVLSTLAPKYAFASDSFRPLIEIFETLKTNPNTLVDWYHERWEIAHGATKKDGYEKIRSSFNKHPNAADLLFLCRACYGGVVRFRKSDGFMSTPVGVHEPVTPESFKNRAILWHERVQNTVFSHVDYKEAMQNANHGDLVYCDPPYKFSQAILYGGQDFKLDELFKEIEHCKRRGVFVALSIDGTKKSGDFICDLRIPPGLFEREISVNTGKSMLKRFQMEGKTLDREDVSDRLLLTYET